MNSHTGHLYVALVDLSKGQFFGFFNMLLLDVNKISYFGSGLTLKRTNFHISVHVTGLKYLVFATNFESCMTSLDILVKVTICYKHLNMLNFIMITFIKYILPSMLRILA